MDQVLMTSCLSTANFTLCHVSFSGPGESSHLHITRGGMYIALNVDFWIQSSGFWGCGGMLAMLAPQMWCLFFQGLFCHGEESMCSTCGELWLSILGFLQLVSKSLDGIRKNPFPGLIFGPWFLFYLPVRLTFERDFSAILMVFCALYLLQ